MIVTRIVPKHEIESVWPQIEAWVKASLGADVSYSPDDVKRACLNRMELGLVYAPELTGFMVFQIYDSPQAKCCYSPWLGGENLGEWAQEAIGQFKDFLRAQGVSQYSFIGRKAWERLVKADYQAGFYLMKL